MDQPVRSARADACPEHPAPLAAVLPPVLAASVGPLAGELLCAPQEAESLQQQLAALLVSGADAAQPLARGVHAHEIAIEGAPRKVVVKSFPRWWWRDRHFRAHGSKARASFHTALRLLAHGVGTPRPIAWLDRWDGGRLLASHYVCAFEQGTSFGGALEQLFREDPLCRRILALMEAVAGAAARMHAAGVCHFDLGNQNILVDRIDDDSWGNVRFIDLDRARVIEAPSLKHCARDLSRIALPSALLPIFHRMYFGHREPPETFLRWERHYRRRFAFHTASRKYRHPIRTLRAARTGAARALEPYDLWMWDDRSEQAIGTRLKGDRYIAYPWRNGVHVARGLARGALAVRRIYGELLAGAFQRPVSLEGRIGLAVGTTAGFDDAERALLEALGPLPLMVRLHRHVPHARNGEVLAEARRLAAAGHPIFVGLLQDAASARSPDLWARFVDEWLPPFAGLASGIEVGHAVNRVKWGIQDFREYGRMVDTVLQRAQSLAPIEFTGPACIDFEYHFLAGLLDVVPDGCFAAMSHHLYVDRRGAPENRQGPFSCIEKFALAKAIAAWSPAIRGDRLIISEVNWPVAGTGVHSPVAAPYLTADNPFVGPAVDEETYADYMLRYYALALCSGLVERVYWWRLVSHGFGLVDDARTPWRPRPAYAALRQFVSLLGRATFLQRLPAPEGVWALRFRQPQGTEVVMAWAHREPVRYAPRFSSAAMVSRDGLEGPTPRGGVLLSGTPAYFIDVR